MFSQTAKKERKENNLAQVCDCRLEIAFSLRRKTTTPVLIGTNTNVGHGCDKVLMIKHLGGGDLCLKDTSALVSY